MYQSEERGMFLTKVVSAQPVFVEVYLRGVVNEIGKVQDRGRQARAPDTTRGKKVSFQPLHGHRSR